MTIPLQLGKTHKKQGFPEFRCQNFEGLQIQPFLGLFFGLKSHFRPILCQSNPSVDLQCLILEFPLIETPKKNITVIESSH